MDKFIVKETKHGTDGPWIVDAREKCSPRGFLKVCKAPSSAQSGVGGYITRIRIDNKILSPYCWSPSNLKEAKELIDFIDEPEQEYSTWSNLR